MTDSRMAIGLDRLPWLPDEPARSRNSGGRELLGWAVAAAVVVAGGSYWLGTRTGSVEPAIPTDTQPSATLALPEPRRVEPNVQPVRPPEAQRVIAPEIRPVIQSSNSVPVHRLPRTVPPSVAERVRRTVVTGEIERVSIAQRTPPAPVARAAPTQYVRLWPARQSAGAWGRVVQIGAFGSRYQAKRGWWHMARAYPGVKRLPAVVVESRNSRGRPFYRFQIGTTSQAHSEILCQRMQRIRFSCAVVGLPWKAKVER